MDRAWGAGLVRRIVFSLPAVALLVLALYLERIVVVVFHGEQLSRWKRLGYEGLGIAVIILLFPVVAQLLEKGSGKEPSRGTRVLLKCLWFICVLGAVGMTVAALTTLRKG